MDRKQAKKRLRVVRSAIRNAYGIDRMQLENEIKVLLYIIEKERIRT